MKLARHFLNVTFPPVETVRKIFAAGGLATALGAAAYFGFSDLFPKTVAVPQELVVVAQEDAAIVQLGPVLAQ